MHLMNDSIVTGAIKVTDTSTLTNRDRYRLDFGGISHCIFMSRAEVEELNAATFTALTGLPDPMSREIEANRVGNQAYRTAYNGD